MQTNQSATNSISISSGISQEKCQSGIFQKSKVPYYGPYSDSYNIDMTKPPVNTLEIHPVANSLHEYILTDLIESIKTNGQLDDILVWRNPKTRRLMVVNGRHRMWACNVLGIKVSTKEITAKEDQLPKAILDQQLLARGTDRVFATITLMEYIDTHNVKAVDLLKSYHHLAIPSRDIGDARKIAKVMPTWITALKLGKGIRIPGSSYSEVKSLRALADACKTMERDAAAPLTIYQPKPATPEAKAMGSLLNSVRSVLSSSDTLVTPSMKQYILNQLLLEYNDVPTMKPSPESYQPYEGEIYGELL